MKCLAYLMVLSNLVFALANSFVISPQSFFYGLTQEQINSSLARHTEICIDRFINPSIKNGTFEDDLDTLLQLNADPNYIDTIIEDSWWTSPLLSLAHTDSSEFFPLSVKVSKRLFELNPTVDIRDDTKSTPFMWAIMNNNIELAKLLLSHGADINATNIVGQSSFYASLVWQKPQALKLLLENHVEPVIYRNTTKRNAKGVEVYSFTKDTTNPFVYFTIYAHGITPQSDSILTMLHDAGIIKHGPEDRSDSVYTMNYGRGTQW